MARRYEMTWIPKRRGWYKKYKGQLYTVSARQLGCPETKEGSYLAANEWWAQKLREIEQPRKQAVAEVERITQELLSATLEGSVAQAVKDVLLQLQDAPQEVVGQVLPKLQAVRGRVEAALPPPEPEKTVAFHVEQFLVTERLRLEAKQIDLTRYDAYRRDIQAFEKWFGKERSVEEISELIVENYYHELLAKVAEREKDRTKGISPVYAQNVFGTFKMFVTRLAEKRLIPLPANLLSNRFRFRKPKKTPEHFTVEEVRTLLAGCDGKAEKTKLYLLLMLNCGMYQNDITELQASEVDWEKGLVKRYRSKTKEKGEMEVTYKLWPETFALLQKFRAEGSDVVLLTEAGKPLVQQGLKEEGNMSRTDNIKSAYVRLCQRLKLPTKPLKNLRKTASNKLGEHRDYKYYQDYFLAHSPRSQKDKHYVVPSDEEFFQALDWLRRKLLAEQADAKKEKAASARGQ